MRSVCLLAVTLTVLVASNAAQDNEEQWTVSVGEESLQQIGQLSINDLGSKIPDDDIPAVEDAPSRKKRATCGFPYKFTKAQKRATLRIHNELRAKEGASDMAYMTWDNNLARRAHQWAAQCKWWHGMRTYCDGAPIGQNLYMAMNGRSYPKVNVTAVIANGWWAEKKFYNYYTLHCKSGQMCGHYTQVVWAKSLQVGCSIVNCPSVQLKNGSPWKRAVIFACDYAPSGNYEGRKAYKKGRACSKCNTVVKKGYYCKNKLCRECSRASHPGCNCIKLECEHGSRYNKRLCRCMCPRGYWGVRCQKDCTCKDHYWACSTYKHLCRKIEYFEWLRKTCPNTCRNTCERPTKNDCK